MLVKCPSCATTYKVSDELLKGPTPAFRCSRCKHTFELELELPDEPAVPPTSPDVTATEDNDNGQELAFSFGPPEHGTDSAEVAQQINSAPPDSGVEPPPAAVSAREDLQETTIPPAPAKQPETVSIVGNKASRKEDKLPDRDDETAPREQTFDDGLPPPQSNNVSVLDPYRDQQASTLPYLTLFALLTLFFSIATAFQYAYPELLDRWIKKVPLLGTAVVKNSHLKNGVALQSLRGSYQAIQGNREVFLVTGVAMNQNSVVIREVRVSGETYGTDEKSLEQQNMWIGNAISPKIVRGMTAQDIADLQRLKPLKTFEIPPGDSVPFTIVFLKPAKAVKNFTCTVLSAEEEV